MGSDNRLELDAQICLNGKKKSPGKRIIGFEVFFYIQKSSKHVNFTDLCINTILFLQFSPSDPSKLMVSSVDSPVHIISGVDVICKFKGTPILFFQVDAKEERNRLLTFFPVSP